jgi:predicted RNase H-like HicB family nuclease
MSDYAVIYEQAGDGSWSASAADLPVFSCGATPEEAEREIRDAITLHLEVLRERGVAIPSARSIVGTVSVPG